MHSVNRCLKNMLLSIWYQDVFPQGVCPPACSGTHRTQQHRGGHGLLCSSRCKSPRVTPVLKVLLPQYGKRSGR